MDSRGQPPPPERNIEGGAVSLIGDFDRRPWAAYVFGHHSWTVRMWLELAWIRPGFEWEDVWGNVPLAVEELQHARLVLASVIPPNVFELLDPALRHIEDLNRDLEFGWTETMQYGGREFGTDPCPGEEQWSELRIVAEQTLAESTTLIGWYNLGTAVGRCRWDAWSRSNDDQRFPDLAAIVTASTAIPMSDRLRVPIVNGIAREADAFRRDRAATFLRRLIDRHPTIWAFGSPLSQGEPAGWQMVSTLTRINSQIQDSVRGIPSRASRRRRQRERPSWDQESGELQIGDVVVRDVRTGVAQNIVLLLDVFQESGWDQRVDNPFPPPNDGERLGETVKSVNKGLSLIKFRRDGRGEGAEWHWIDDPA